MAVYQAPTFDFNRAASLHFSDRPTLRQVASEQLLKVLLAELPWLASVQPKLSSADALTLDSPDPSASHWTTQPFVDGVLQALLKNQPVDLEPVEGRHHNLGLLEPYRFHGSEHALDTRQLPDLSAQVSAMIEQLPQLFCQAQLDYWTGIGNAGVSRDHWIQLLLKTSLLRGLPLQGLDAQEQACIRGLLRGGRDQPSVSFVQASLKADDEDWDLMLCHLLITGEWDSRQVVLWCSPSGTVRGFESLSAFALALRDELAFTYRFDELSWRQYPVEGDAFAQQAALLLETLFTQVEQLHFERLTDVAALERLFAQLSDPAQWFASYPDDTPAVLVPSALSSNSSSDSFAYQCALQQLAIANLDADGVAALDGVHSLQDYTRQRLVDRMRLDHGDETSPDDLMLEFFVAHGMPGGAAVGAGGGEPVEIVGEKSLTEFAIGNLGALKNASISRIRHANGEPGPAWLDADAARRLVSQVDIGGTYPGYVAAQLDDPQHRPLRMQRFAREWRSSLWFSALAAKRDGKITDDGLQAVVDFCSGHLDPQTPRVTLMPLAFRRQPHSRLHEQVRGMYLLFCAEPGLVLLYRPLYQQDTLRQYTSLGAVLEHIQQSPLLQQSILDWMDPKVRHLYDHGGFSEPHVSSVGTDPYSLPERPQPPVIHTQYWTHGLDEKLYNANRDLLVEIADMQSTSNAERRWETLTEGAWLLFDVVTLVLRGPVATVAWLVQLLSSLESDLQALEQQNEFNRSAAVADLLLNLGMGLLHLHQPTAPWASDAAPVNALAFEGPPAQGGAFTEFAVLPRTEPVAAIGELVQWPERKLDLSWRGNQGFNWMPPVQRQALRAMRANVELPESALLSTGDRAGLYLIEGQLYAAMAGDAYPVEVVEGGVRVQDGQGGYGPWLISTMGAWRVDLSLRLAGGMPKKNALADKMGKLFVALREEADRLTLEANTFTDTYSACVEQVSAFSAKIVNAQGRLDAEQKRLDSLGDGAERDKSATLVGLFTASITRWEAEQLLKREEAVQALEAAVAKREQVLQKYEKMLEGKFSGPRADGWNEILLRKKQEFEGDLICYNEFILNELWAMADYPTFFAMQQRLEGRPASEASTEFGAYRQKATELVAIQERMLSASEKLDVLLVQAPADQQINLIGKAATTVTQIIAERKISTLQLRFHQAQTIVDLALHLDAPLGRKRIAEYRDQLAGTDLRNAASAHGELDFVNLSLEDRISILQEAWDEYAKALIDCYLIGENGGELIHVDMLARYAAELDKLKADAGKRLVDAVGELEGGAVAFRRVAYVTTNDQQQVVRNAAGQIAIGTERAVDGQRVLEARDFIKGEVLAIFDWRDDGWHERKEQEPAVDLEPEADTADMAMRVQSLLDENQQVLRTADEYIKADIKAPVLIRLFDRQMQKLSREAARLNEENANPALIKSLEFAADTLRSEKQRKLTMLYTDTKYPTAEALRFLHDQGLLKVSYEERRTMKDKTTFDEYQIQCLTQSGDIKGRSLWAAHFHFARDDAFARDFTVGHLKMWSERRKSNQPEIGMRVHRGRLTLEQANGIIPFD
jgi:hypothetical protein